MGGSNPVRRGHAPQLDARFEHSERQHFGEVGKERSRRTLIYSHNWRIKEGHEQTAVIAQDAARLAANCDCELELSSSSPELGPKFGPDLIMFNGRGDECEDFIYPPVPTEGQVPSFFRNHGKCRTECRDYDTLVSAILLSIKHHLGCKANVRSTARPDSAGWTAAFELYSRTFPKREIPQLNNWTRRDGFI